MILKSRILFFVIAFLLHCLSYAVLAEKKADSNNNYFIEVSGLLNNLDNQQAELYNEILKMININKKKDNVKIDMKNQLDSLLICFEKIKNYIDGKVIKIFYHDSEDVYLNLEDLYKYLEENNYQAISYCTADGPDGTNQVYLKNRAMLLLTSQWDGGDDSDTTYIPSKYFETSFYLIKLNQPDSVVISNVNK